MTQQPVIVLFERDLRLCDHAPLHAAVQSGHPIIPLFIFDEQSPNIRPLGGASRWRLHQSLQALQQQLAACGGTLILRRGAIDTVLPQMMAQTNARAVYAHSNYVPVLAQRDAALSVDVQRFAGQLLIEPDAIKTGAGDYYKVFTPFWRACLREMYVADPLPAPTLNAACFAPSPPSDTLTDWQLLPQQPNWAVHFTNNAGEVAAQRLAQYFCHNSLTHYKEKRDFPALGHTSTLSAHIHFGEISVRQLWHMAQQTLLPLSDPLHEVHNKSVAHFLSELGWREFSYYLLHYFNDLPTHNFRPVFDSLAWRHAPRDLQRWQQGHTGYPLVDAAMQCLRRTGTMHNRLRMVVASFLVKHLLIDWRHGEAWFWDNLLDADLASNTASWQWVAGSGADAAPYFRVFNPLLQAQRFDPDNAFTRQWLRHHTLQPIIDVDAGRKRALAAFEQLPKA